MTARGRVIATFTSPVSAELVRAVLDAAGPGGTVEALGTRPPRVVVYEPAEVHTGG